MQSRLLAAIVTTLAFGLATIPNAAAQRTAYVVTSPIELASKVDRLELTGTIESTHSVEIYPAVGDVVTAVFFAAGESISEGEPLVQLNNRREKVALELAEINLRDAQRRLDRLVTIHSQAAASQQELDAAIVVRDLAANRVAQAQVEFDEHLVIAPISGVAGLSDVRVGDRITSNTVITTLDNLDTLFVLIRVPESAMEILQHTQHVDLYTWGSRSEPIIGTVTDIDSRIDPISRTLKVRLAIDNSSGSLRPGMSLRATIESSGAPFVKIPEAALLWGASGAYVWVRDDAGLAQRHNVEVVQRTEGAILVQSDLKAGQSLIVEGVQRLRSNQPVELVN